SEVEWVIIFVWLDASPPARCSIAPEIERIITSGRLGSPCRRPDRGSRGDTGRTGLAQLVHGFFDAFESGGLHRQGQFGSFCGSQEGGFERQNAEGSDTSNEVFRRYRLTRAGGCG